jgi:hypothetical protein
LAKGGQEGFKKGGNQMARKIMNRRNFMKSTLVSVAGFPLLASGVLKQEEKVEEKGGEKRKFIKNAC